MKFIKRKIKKQTRLTGIPSIDREKTLPYFGILLLIGAAYLVGKIFHPYIWLAFWAMLFYISFYRFNRKLAIFLRRKRVRISIKDCTATISTFLTFILIIVPGAMLIRYLIVEMYSLGEKLHIFLSDKNIFDTIENLPIISALITKQPFFWVEVFNLVETFSRNYGSYLDPNQIGSWVGELFIFLQGSIDFTLGLTINLFLIMFLVYFLFRDGSAFYHFLRKNMPFPSRLTDHFTKQIHQTVLDLLKGTVFISMLQGGLIAMALLLCGFKNAIILGSIAALFSVIPIIGTAIIWLPSSLYLALIDGHYLAAIFLAVFSLSVYLILENIVKPKLFVSKLGIHPVFLFFAILGGLVEFGFIGFLLGPLFLVLLKTIWNIYHVWGPKTD